MSQSPTEEEVIALRLKADRAAKESDRLSHSVSMMYSNLNWAKSELIIAKRNNKDIVEKVYDCEQAQITYDEYYKKWNDCIDSQAELWEVYCTALDAYEAKVNVV